MTEMQRDSADSDRGLRERLREALLTHEDGQLNVAGGRWVCRCDCFAVLKTVDDHVEHRLDALIAAIAPPSTERDCNGQALGSSCECITADECPTTPADGGSDG